MELSGLRRHWERFGRRDPYWAVLTDPDKQGGGWDVAEFFQSGKDEIDAALQRAGGFGIALSRRRALDFGCGAGRLTQAMATQFERCDGVDISESMLAIARRHNRYPERCEYHLNDSSDLALFGDQSFDFVYSTLVLQHMEPRYSTLYIREFLRVLAPKGLLVFQVPSQRSTEAAPADAQQTPIGGPLPPDAFRAHVTMEPQSLSADSGKQLSIDVTVENRSRRAWPSLPGARGHHQIMVANHWLHEDGEVLQRDDGRCPLPFDVQPGSRASVMLVVTTPPADGFYVLELDLVQEDVAWFAERGSSVLRVPVVVGNAAAAPRRVPKAPPLPPSPFRMRHPRAFEMMRATGVRDAYWAWRRGLDRAKASRDRVIVSVRDGLFIPRLINRWRRELASWRRGLLAARMEMYCLPRAEVLALLKDAGGRIVNVDEERTPGYQSCRYWVSKD